MSSLFVASCQRAASRAAAVRGPSARRRFGSGSDGLEDVVVVSAVRTPIGTLGGALAAASATTLGATAVAEAVKRAGVPAAAVTQALVGNVLSAGLGQAPARQVAKRAGLPDSTVCTTINKVCASGMKAFALAAQDIALRHHDAVVAAGTESMSNVPYYLEGARNGYRYGHQQVADGILRDGLWDAFDDHHMGNAGEHCAKKYNISRAEMDAFAIASYKKANAAAAAGHWKGEIVPVTLAGKRGDSTVVSEDEQPKKINYDRVATLKPAFAADGSITAANASPLNDGAAALVLMAASKARALGLKPLARVRGFADAEQAPIEFTTAPAAAVPRALKHAGVATADVDLWEINEAFAVVVLANQKLLGIDPATVNVNGGAIALGHPIGCSGARILTTLVHLLHARASARIGVASICNGGGGATAVVLEKL